MRELTELEIDRFDFTGLIPDMNVSIRRNSAAAAAKKPQREYAMKAKLSHRPRRPQLGIARTA